MEIGIIIQARMSSNRLPGKTFMKILDNQTMLDIVIKRLSNCQKVNRDQLIIATSDDPSDQPIVDWCHQNNIKYCVGSLDNVLERFTQTARKFNLNTIVRITADCPGIDPLVVDNAIKMWYNNRQNHNKYDYISNTLQRTFPRGMDVEIFSRNALETASNNAKNNAEIEHVTPYIYGHCDIFKIGHLREENGNDYSQYRLTVDTIEDLELARTTFKTLGDNFNYLNLIEFFKSHPELTENYSDLGKQTKFQSNVYYLENNLL